VLRAFWCCENVLADAKQPSKSIFSLSQGAIKTLQDSWREQQIAQGEQLRAYLATRAGSSFQAISPCRNNL